MDGWINGWIDGWVGNISDKQSDTNSSIKVHHQYLESCSKYSSGLLFYSAMDAIQNNTIIDLCHIL